MNASYNTWTNHTALLKASYSSWRHHTALLKTSYHTWRHHTAPERITHHSWRLHTAPVSTTQHLNASCDSWTLLNVPHSTPEGIIQHLNTPNNSSEDIIRDLNASHTTPEYTQHLTKLHDPWTHHVAAVVPLSTFYDLSGPYINPTPLYYVTPPHCVSFRCVSRLCCCSWNWRPSWRRTTWFCYRRPSRSWQNSWKVRGHTHPSEHGFTADYLFIYFFRFLLSLFFSRLLFMSLWQIELGFFPGNCNKFF